MKKLKENGFEKIKFSPPSCTELLKRFQNKGIFHAKKMEFAGVGGKDVYNPSKPFVVDGEQIIAGRVEAREDIAKSEIVFFRHEKGMWVPVYGAPTFQLEDGCVRRIGDELILWGTEVYSKPTLKYPEQLGFCTAFYRGRDLGSLKRFAVGPEQIKDIGIEPLWNGHIGIFTRPVEGEYGKGKIGFIELLSLKEINQKNLLKARIIENQFASNEWGGVNDTRSFKNIIHVIGHVAYEDETKHYFAMEFAYNITKHVASPIRIIATRQNFPAGVIKDPSLRDIVFPRGFIDNNGSLMTSLSDAEVYIAHLNSKEIGITKKPVSYIYKERKNGN